jgi:hypothetical protein
MCNELGDNGWFGNETDFVGKSLHTLRAVGTLCVHGRLSTYFLHTKVVFWTRQGRFLDPAGPVSGQI